MKYTALIKPPLKIDHLSFFLQSHRIRIKIHTKIIQEPLKTYRGKKPFVSIIISLNKLYFHNTAAFSNAQLFCLRNALAKIACHVRVVLRGDVSVFESVFESG